MVLTKEIIQEMLDTGIILLGSKKCGKSNAAKVMAKEIINGYPNIQCRIFDPCLNWVNEFEPIVYTVMNRDSRYYYCGDKNVLYDMEYIDVDDMIARIEQIAEYDFIVQRQLKKTGKLDRWIVYFVEEAQNVLGSYAKSKILFRFISEGRNYHMAFIGISQRGAEISTKVVERCQGYLFGRASGDRDRRKIKGIVGDAVIEEEFNPEMEWNRITGKEISEEVARLRQGQFIWFNGDYGRLIQFPLYKSDTKPILMGRNSIE